MWRREAKPGAAFVPYVQYKKFILNVIGQTNFFLS